MLEQNHWLFRLFSQLIYFTLGTNWPQSAYIRNNMLTTNSIYCGKHRVVPVGPHIYSFSRDNALKIASERAPEQCAYFNTATLRNVIEPRLHSACLSLPASVTIGKDVCEGSHSTNLPQSIWGRYHSKCLDSRRLRVSRVFRRTYNVNG